MPDTTTITETLEDPQDSQDSPSPAPADAAAPEVKPEPVDAAETPQDDAPEHDGKRALRQRAQDAEAKVAELTDQLAQRDAHVEELGRRLVDQAMSDRFPSTLFWKLREAGTDGLLGDDGTVDRKALHEECIRLDKEYGMHTGVWRYGVPKPDMSSGLTSHGDSASGWGNIVGGE